MKSKMAGMKTMMTTAVGIETVEVIMTVRT